MLESFIYDGKKKISFRVGGPPKRQKNLPISKDHEKQSVKLPKTL